MKPDTMLDRADLAVARIRHPLAFRLLEVKRVQPVSSHLVRVTLGGAELQGFISASFDDHIKVFFPAPGTDRPALPAAGPNGAVFAADQPRPIARDFTPRRHDAAAGELDIEFALHEAGPAAAWAAQASVGQMLGIGGPRGSFVIPMQFDWHLLIGDDTALPAIARRLEELPSTTTAIALLEVPQPSARLELRSAARLQTQWYYRDPLAEPASDSGLLAALRALQLPDGEGYVWAAGEATAMRAVRAYLCNERGIVKTRIRAASYWKRGAAAVHEALDD